jgi:hypothetical protein
MKDNIVISNLMRAKNKQSFFALHQIQSKITHFIGHTQGKGKPKQFLDRVDKYLTEHNFL